MTRTDERGIFDARVFLSRRVEIIANDMGNRTTPSYVAFTDSERLIGDSAQNQVRDGTHS